MKQPHSPQSRDASRGPHLPQPDKAIYRTSVVKKLWRKRHNSPHQKKPFFLASWNQRAKRPFTILIIQNIQQDPRAWVPSFIGKMLTEFALQFWERVPGFPRPVATQGTPQAASHSLASLCKMERFVLSDTSCWKTKMLSMIIGTSFNWEMFTCLNDQDVLNVYISSFANPGG